MKIVLTFFKAFLDSLKIFNIYFPKTILNFSNSGKIPNYEKKGTRGRMYINNLY